ncbi:hypothetical protein K469DRAFT_695106 [Zopfia rhizophila CBS 207.26]|uniref:Uncharacterized protein n=1 Tax=Zopfia rhizophila CBS 207.26 TaxID=1314779 RepID=A0A6A6DGX9_9PEZI|nr:hypothetical protein K469DRAFT_695106 [Zopfia rhizophila CBS 207.26]
MHSSTILALLMAIVSASVIPTVLIDLSLIPAFGLAAGQDPNGSGSCVGANNILIPCFCPPDREEFIEKITMGRKRIALHGSTHARSAKEQRHVDLDLAKTLQKSPEN